MGFIFLIALVYQFFISVVGGLITSLFYENDKPYKVRYSLLITRNIKVNIILILLIGFILHPIFMKNFVTENGLSGYNFDFLGTVIKTSLLIAINYYISKRCEKYLKNQNQNQNQNQNIKNNETKTFLTDGELSKLIILLLLITFLITLILTIGFIENKNGSRSVNDVQKINESNEYLIDTNKSNSINYSNNVINNTSNIKALDNKYQFDDVVIYTETYQTIKNPYVTTTNPNSITIDVLVDTTMYTFLVLEEDCKARYGTVTIAMLKEGEGVTSRSDGARVGNWYWAKSDNKRPMSVITNKICDYHYEKLNIRN